MTPSVRAQVITRRTYNRPTDTGFESWEQTVDRVIKHQTWLWRRALSGDSVPDFKELEELRALFLSRKALPSGRTLWLGGTEISRTRESSMFNCAGTLVETAWDVVDVLWLLLQGCGVGFKPVPGTLTGFRSVIPQIEVIRSERSPDYKGRQNNVETFEKGVWTIGVGDSAEAWAKSIGKLMAGRYPAKKLVLDLSEIRGAGSRLKGYGWISSGDSQIAVAYTAIAEILNKRAGSLLRRMDILDIINWLGTILSSRRSAEIALFEYGGDEWREFAVAKKDFWLGNTQRAQSNNSLLFNTKPSREQLAEVFKMMVDSGGSEPGFINAAAARQRAPWFSTVNPCAEILLGNKSFCNLTEIDLSKFVGDSAGLRRAAYLIARANYRQTCVDLRDGVLQEAWHLNNDYLRLCGVGLTGIVTRPDMTEYDFADLRRMATYGAMQMADELGTPRPKNITTVKPSGTLSKIMDTTEGAHKPLGRYVFNNVQFSRSDPLVEKLRAANYHTFPHPYDLSSTLVRLPVEWSSVEFDVVDGRHVNLEPAVAQLERYLMLMRNWCDQNVSVTISYSVEEVPAIIDWLLTNWDRYVGVSFLFRTDPTKTAQDLGFPYLPQEVVDEATFREYRDQLLPVDVDETLVPAELEDPECATGACPIR